jgi:hypothetical protein
MKYLLFGIIAFQLPLACSESEKKNGLPTNNITVQTFKIPHQKDTILIGEKGTVLKIRKSTFSEANGKEIELTLKEYYTVQDFIYNKLSTNTVDGKVLKSGGMIFLEAKSGDKPLKVNDANPITIMFPKIKETKNPYLFSGEIGTSGIIKWGNPIVSYNDTIIKRIETIKKVGYGQEEVTIDYQFLIGYDTIIFSNLTGAERSTFKKLLFRILSNSTYDSTRGTTEVPIFTINENDYYAFETSKLKFINCDFFINEELFPFKVVLENSQSEVLVVLNNLNSVLLSDSVNRATNEYIFFLPKNKSITVAAHQNRGNSYFFDMRQTNSSNSQIKLKQKKTPLDSIQKLIAELK